CAWHLYSQAGFSYACISLQYEFGVDVNLLLFLLWLAAGGRQLSVEDIKELDEAVRPWRELTIIPIREVRRGLKGVRTLVEAGKQKAFRTRIKAIELEAESLQQEALYSRSLSSPLGREAETTAAAHANIAAYAQSLGAGFRRAAVDCLLAAFAAIKHDNFALRCPYWNRLSPRGKSHWIRRLMGRAWPKLPHG